MTAIAAVKKDGVVWMGGDSRISWHKRAVANKVFKHGEMVIGGTGTSRYPQVVQYCLEPPLDEEKDPMRYLVRSWIPALRKCLTDEGALKKHAGNDNNLEGMGCELVLGYKGRIFGVCSGLSVMEILGDYYATGSGGDVCSGALYATPHLKPRARILAALRAASHHVAGIGEPFQVICTPIVKPQPKKLNRSAKQNQGTNKNS